MARAYQIDGAGGRGSNAPQQRTDPNTIQIRDYFIEQLNTDFARLGTQLTR